MTTTDDALEPVVRDALALCAIPAPTFAEEARGVAVERRLRDAGLAPRRDGAGNVVARVGGDGPAVAVAAHLDTVFPAATPLDPRRDGDVLRGPGIGDNAIALASLLDLARSLAGRPPARPVLLAATTGEEGLGDLRGVRELLDTEAVACLVALEGHGVDSLTVAGVASARFRATYRGPGGHSWGDRGRPSALHALFAAGSRAVRVAAPAHANVGVASGGLSVNTIAATASLEIDLRHEDDGVVEEAAARVRSTLRATPDGIDVEVEPVGRRPGGRLADDHPLLVEARRARERAGLPRAAEEAASTDANAALARGIPALALGMTRGGAVHRTDEWIEVPPLAGGLEVLHHLVRAVAGG